ncbi:11811_t:CDS:1, partial [Racocetra persica]
IYRGLRPKIPTHIPRVVNELINKCWRAQPNKRPSSQEIYDTLNAWNINNIFDKESTNFIEQTESALHHFEVHSE